VNFGLSTRTYEVKVDYTRMRKAMEDQKRDLERQMEHLVKLDNHAELDVDTLKSSMGLVRQDTLYVANLPYHYEEQDIENLFKDCGKVVSIRVP